MSNKIVLMDKNERHILCSKEKGNLRDEKNVEKASFAWQLPFLLYRLFRAAVLSCTIETGREKIIWPKTHCTIFIKRILPRENI